MFLGTEAYCHIPKCLCSEIYVQKHKLRGIRPEAHQKAFPRGIKYAQKPMPRGPCRRAHSKSKPNEILIPCQRSSKATTRTYRSLGRCHPRKSRSLVKRNNTEGNSDRIASTQGNPTCLAKDTQGKQDRLAENTKVTFKTKH